jgi:MFS family permease
MRQPQPLVARLTSIRRPRFCYGYTSMLSDSSVGMAFSAQGAALSTSREQSRVTAALCGTLFFTMLPVTMMVPVLKEIVTERFGTGTFAAHFFMSINMIGAILTAPLTASLADRAAQRKTVLLIALIFNLTTLTLMPLADSFALFMTLRFFEGAFHVLAISTIMACAADWADPTREGRQMGMMGASLIFGTACGAPMGGMIGQSNPMMVFALGVVCVAIGTVLTFALIREAPGRARCTRFVETIDLLRTRHTLLIPYAFSFVDRFCVGVIVSSFVLFLGEAHGYSPAQRGGLLALFLFPFAILCYPAGRLADRYGRAVLMIAGNASFGLAFAAYGIAPESWLPALMLASGVFSAMFFSPNLAMCGDLAPPHQRAAAFAGFNMAGSLGFLCGPLVGGAVHRFATPSLGSLRAYSLAFAVAGVVVLGCALVFGPSLIRLSKKE